MKHKEKKNRSKRAIQAFKKTKNHKYCLLKEQKMAIKRRRKAWKKFKKRTKKIYRAIPFETKVWVVIEIIKPLIVMI